jgi:hypothetical protein
MKPSIIAAPKRPATAMRLALARPGPLPHPDLHLMPDQNRSTACIVPSADFEPASNAREHPRNA